MIRVPDVYLNNKIDIFINFCSPSLLRLPRLMKVLIFYLGGHYGPTWLFMKTVKIYQGIDFYFLGAHYGPSSLLRLPRLMKVFILWIIKLISSLIFAVLLMVRVHHDHPKNKYLHKPLAVLVKLRVHKYHPNKI
jgi:hypothetical protein